MTHLIVFIHGFEGTGHDFDKAEKIFKERASAINDELQIRLLKVQCNSTFGGTYDGIEPGAVRIWKSVMQVLRNEENNIKAISIVGHSLGGLYGRFLLRLLDDCFVFDSVEARFFVSLASPHMSIRRPLTGPFNLVFHHAAKSICRTTRELSLEDNGASPILYRMTEKSFTSVLLKFKRRILYSNVLNDFQVPFPTASISLGNPYNRDKNLLTRSTKYTDLTEWSLNNVEQRLHHDLEDLELFAKRDPQGRLLRAMFVRLNEISWERYDAVFSTVFAHEQIINKRTFFAGKDVMQHLADTMIQPRPILAPL